MCGGSRDPSALLSTHMRSHIGYKYSKSGEDLLKVLGISIFQTTCRICLVMLFDDACRKLCIIAPQSSADEPNSSII